LKQTIDNIYLRTSIYYLWANLPAWSAAALRYKAVPTWHLRSVSSFSSNDLTRWSPSTPQKMPNFSQRAFFYLSCILIWYCHSRHEVCSHAHVLLEY